MKKIFPYRPCHKTSINVPFNNDERLCRSPKHLLQIKSVINSLKKYYYNIMYVLSVAPIRTSRSRHSSSLQPENIGGLNWCCCSGRGDRVIARVHYCIGGDTRVKSIYRRRRLRDVPNRTVPGLRSGPDLTRETANVRKKRQ